MRLVQIQLKSSIPFWFLDDIIKLNQNNRVSDFINIDSLTEPIRTIIDLSVRRHEINITDYHGNKINSLDEVICVCGDMAVDTEDIQDDPEEELIPEMVSVTVSMLEEKEEEKEEEQLPVEPSEKHIENSKILLEQNGNTIKKMIRNMKQTDDNLMILNTSMALEMSGKNRKGIITAMQNAIAGY